jgi:hypothetical protein
MAGLKTNNKFIAYTGPLHCSGPFYGFKVTVHGCGFVDEKAVKSKISVGEMRNGEKV